MSRCADAFLFWGLEFGEECPIPDDIWGDMEDDWNDALAPPRPPDDGTSHGRGNPAWDEWRTKLRAWEKSGEGIECGYHTSFETPGYYLAPRGLHFQVSWGGAKAFMDGLPDPTEEHMATLRGFCKKNAIPWQEPCWQLTVRYG